MSDYNHRNQAFDYAPPTTGGSGKGALLLVGGLVVVFILAMAFLGANTENVAPEGGPASAVAPTDGGASGSAPAPAPGPGITQ